MISAVPPERKLERVGCYDLLAGEAELQDRAAAAMRRSDAAALVGWIPVSRLPEVTAALADAGGAVVPLARPAWSAAPTLLAETGLHHELTPLVQTYGTVPYADVDPSWLAWASYVVMFGMMFGDAGQGVLLVAGAVALRLGWPRWVRRFRAAWPFVGGAGLAATAFGLLYRECFGPTGLVPVLWLSPLAQPVLLLLSAVGFGAILLAGAYALGTINRWREDDWRSALYAPSGIAGSFAFVGAAAGTAGVHFHQTAWLAAAVWSRLPVSDWRSPGSWQRRAVARQRSRRHRSNCSASSSGWAQTSCPLPALGRDRRLDVAVGRGAAGTRVPQR